MNGTRRYSASCCSESVTANPQAESHTSVEEDTNHPGRLQPTSMRIQSGHFYFAGKRTSLLWVYTCLSRSSNDRHECTESRVGTPLNADEYNAVTNAITNAVYCSPYPFAPIGRLCSRRKSPCRSSTSWPSSAFAVGLI